MIRKAEQNDLAVCAQVIRESFMTVADTFGFTAENAPRFTAFAISDERLKWQMLKECRPMYVYCDGETIVGFYSLSAPSDGKCELNNLAVLPEHRHKGIGRKLLMHAFKQAADSGCATITIGIVEENKVLRTWYESFGFIHTGTQKFDFFPFTCGYMEKTLDS